MFGFFFGKGDKEKVKEVMAGGAKVIDVRTPGEFENGHPQGALNIPLDQIVTSVEKIKNLGTPIVVCCATGIRSGQAKRILTSRGIETYNAGSWKKVPA